MPLIVFGLLIIATGIAMVFGPGAGIIALGVVVTGTGVVHDLLTPDPTTVDETEAAE